MNKKIIPLLFAAMVPIAVTGCGNSATAGCGNSSCASDIVADSCTAVAMTAQGKVAGYLEDGIYAYKGIPYAKAERFMPPVQPDSWDGVRSSRAYGPVCPQGKRTGWYSDEQAFAFHWDDGYEDENCMRVNVWTSAKSPDGKKRPVMVWLHGGGYAAGSSQELPSYDGANLARRGDVVVVSLNHRLNVLGFLDLSAFGEKYAKSGNAGFLDIIAGLGWVKENIASFGGDPDNVTVFGQSGGGGKVSTLLATPAASGLFHKAIVESGSMLRTMESKYSRRIGIATVEELGLKPAEFEKIKTVPYDELLAAGERAIARVRKEAEAENAVHSFIFGWAPAVDGDVIPAQPCEASALELSRDIPVMIGTTAQEFCASTYVPAFRKMDKAQAVEVIRKKYGDRTDEFINAFEKAYPSYRPADLIDVDLTFRPSAVEQARIRANHGCAPVYMYMFTWESPVMDGIFRSMHCMEIPFVFDNVQRHSTMTGGGAGAVSLAGKMSGAWINFARTGKPYAEGLPEWEPYTSDNGNTMIFNDECTVKHNHDKELLEFIRSFPVRGF